MVEQKHSPAGNSTTTIFGAIGTVEESVETYSISTVTAETIHDLPAGSALLVVTRGSNVGARYLLNAQETTVGRSTSSDIFLDDVTVSRKHAIFYALPDRGGYGLRDSGSLNGSYVNRECVDDCVLKTGDEVQIGKYRMIYYDSPQKHSGEAD